MYDFSHPPSERISFGKNVRISFFHASLKVYDNTLSALCKNDRFSDDYKF